MDKRIGITTTVPIEVIYAAGYIPVDLNNIFIRNSEPNVLIEEAEFAGFPRPFCAWIKGIYSAIKISGIKKIIGVTRGDCSDTSALCEILEGEGIEVITFSYPEKPDKKQMQFEIKKLCNALGATYQQAEEKKIEFDDIRKKLIEIDYSAHNDGIVNGEELFDFQINASDFCGNPSEYNNKCEKFLAEIKGRNKGSNFLRIGMVGIPAIYSDIIGVLEKLGVDVVYYQIPRQFTIPFVGENLDDSYSKYTYPYSFGYQLQDICEQVNERKLDGIIHYVQSFCHRQLYDRMLKSKIKVPVLSIEGDRPSMVDGRTMTRIEAFIETICQENDGI